MRLVFFWRRTTHLNYSSKFESRRRIWYLRRWILLKQWNTKCLLLLGGVEFICINVLLFIKISSLLWSEFLWRSFLTLNWIEIFHINFFLWFDLQLIFKLIRKSICGIIFHFFCMSFKIFSKRKPSWKFNVFLHSQG